MPKMSKKDSEIERVNSIMKTPDISCIDLKSIEKQILSQNSGGFRKDVKLSEGYKLVTKVSWNKEKFDFSKKEDYQWFINNSKDSSLSYLKGQKVYFKERNLEIFDLIEKGCTMDKGELYEFIFKMIN